MYVDSSRFLFLFEYTEIFLWSPTSRYWQLQGEGGSHGYFLNKNDVHKFKVVVIDVYGSSFMIRVGLNNSKFLCGTINFYHRQCGACLFGELIGIGC